MISKLACNVFHPFQATPYLNCSLEEFTIGQWKTTQMVHFQLKRWSPKLGTMILIILLLHLCALKIHSRSFFREITLSKYSINFPVLCYQLAIIAEDGLYLWIGLRNWLKLAKNSICHCIVTEQDFSTRPSHSKFRPRNW